MKWFNSKQTPDNQAAKETSVRTPTTDMRSELGIQADGQPAVRIRANRSGSASASGNAVHPEAAAVYDEEVRLHDLKVRTRRRLMGAVVLLTGAFVVLPWIFDDQRKQTAAKVAVTVPDQNVQFEVKNPRATDERIKQAADEVDQKPAQSDALPSTVGATLHPPAKTEIKPAEKKPEPKPESAAALTPSTQKYAVHIGLVSNGKDLDALLSKLRAAGVEPQLKTVVVKGVSKTRVRLGLFDSQAAAAAAAEKAKGAAKNPVVIPIKPSNN